MSDERRITLTLPGEIVAKRAEEIRADQQGDFDAGHGEPPASQWQTERDLLEGWAQEIAGYADACVLMAEDGTVKAVAE